MENAGEVNTAPVKPDVDIEEAVLQPPDAPYIPLPLLQHKPELIVDTSIGTWTDTNQYLEVSDDKTIEDPSPGRSVVDGDRENCPCGRCNESFETSDACNKTFEHSSSHQFHTSHSRAPPSAYNGPGSVFGEVLERKKVMTYHCDACENTFPTKLSLLEHLTSHNIHCCPSCHKRYDQKGLLELHMQTHAHSKSHQCNICGRYFKTIGIKQIHVRGHMVTFRCKICLEYFRSINSLKRHTIQKHREVTMLREGLFHCDVCGVYYRKKKMLVRHMLLQKNVFRCEFCPESYHFERKLKNHIQLAHTDQTYRCYLCGKGYHDVVAFRGHMKAHKSVQIRCSVCTKPFLSKSTLKTHMLRHTGMKTHCCELCAGTFYSKKSLRVHMLDYHRNVISLPCLICKESFKYRKDLREHMACHDRSYICICKQSFYTKELLEKHMSSQKDRHHQCDLCSKVFRNKGTLIKHIFSIHKTLLYKCEICKQAFWSKFFLIKHTNSHAKKVTRLFCLRCGKAFSSNRMLCLHMKLLHNEVSHHQCNYCGKYFTSRAILNKHLPVHTTLYKCNKCDEVFIGKNQYTKHRSTHIPDKQFNCNACPAAFLAEADLIEHRSCHRIIPRFKCIQCGQTFPVKYVLDRHIKADHAAVSRPYICEFCGKTCKNGNDMNMHYVSCTELESNRNKKPTELSHVLRTGSNEQTALPSSKNAASDIDLSLDGRKPSKELKSESLDCTQCYMSFGEMSDKLEHDCKLAIESTTHEHSMSIDLQAKSEREPVGDSKENANEGTGRQVATEDQHSTLFGNEVRARPAGGAAPAPLAVHVIPADVMQRLMEMYQRQQAGVAADAEP